MARFRIQLAVDLVPALFLVCMGISWFSYTIADPDLWGHVCFGLDIFGTGSIVQNDTYSYRTAGQTWINHEWLSELIFAILSNLGDRRLSRSQDLGREPSSESSTYVFADGASARCRPYFYSLWSLSPSGWDSVTRP